jgi:predicted membrane channel-forming protein YqfA (hemolysin III family)
MNDQPTWRKPAGMLLILFIIAVWAVLIASLSHWIGNLPILVQTMIYVFFGIVWIAPLKPLLSWMETGRWRA